jgi:hypothetical protein
MRKNILSALVIFFVTLAFLLMLDDITNSKNTEYQGTVEVYEVSNSSSEMATTDLEDEE